MDLVLITACESSGLSPGSNTGVSWMKRSPTMAGEMMTACASEGTSYFASYHIFTVTSVPDGRTLSTLPTGTPRIRTSEPS